MHFEKHLLDQIRSTLKVSEVVGWTFKLRKQGSEFVAIDDPSITVNDQKGLWYDFGKGESGGDIFEFLQAHGGLTFPQAVEKCAKAAGVNLTPDSRATGSAKQSSKANGRSDDAAHSSARSNAGQGSKREIVETFDYVDASGGLIYQVARLQAKLPDGSWELKNGKPWKSFAQRRPSPDRDGCFVWGLDFVDRQTSEPLEFMRKGPGRDWARFNEANYTKWKYEERRTFPGVGNVDHWLYNANECADELREDRSEQRPIFLPEGEGKVEILKGWELLATTNSGGAKHFTDKCAAFFQGAGDLVILEDNDMAGRERTARIAPMLIKLGARVRVLNFRDVWPACPPKGDIKDWAAQGGTRAQLMEIVDKLSEWKPDPYKSKFGAVRWSERYKGIARTYDWAIKGLVPRGKSVLIYGESQCGKSFETYDMAMHIARGIPFAGRKCAKLGVIYCAAEKGEGFITRMQAYDKHHNIGEEEEVPFAVLTKPIDLWADDATTDQLIDEMIALAADWSVPLGVVVLDTYQAATPGASIIKDEDVTTIYKRCQRIMERTGAGVWVVHHKNAHGTIRGSLVLWNAIETTIEIEILKSGTRPADMVEKRDDDKREIRRASVRKQSEGQKGDHWDFVLRQVKLGIDSDGDPITSCVTDQPASRVPEDVVKSTENRPSGISLSDVEATIFKAMLKGLDEGSIPPPPEMNLPKSVSRIVKWIDVRAQYRRVTDLDDLGKTPEQQATNFKARVSRFRKRMASLEVIGVDTIGEEMVVWPTGKRVYGRGLKYPYVAEPKKQADPTLAPGETADDVAKNVF